MPCCTLQCVFSEGSNHIQEGMLFKRENSCSPSGCGIYCCVWFLFIANPETAWFFLFMWSASSCWFIFLLIQKIVLNVLKIFRHPFIFYYVPCKCLCCRISGLLLASCRVGNKLELWHILLEVQLCHPLEPVDRNTSVGVTLALVFTWFCLIQFDLAVCLNRNTNLVSPVCVSLALTKNLLLPCFWKTEWNFPFLWIDYP